MPATRINTGVNPGLFRNLVSLERDVLTSVNGVEVRTPKTYATNVPALVENLSGSQVYKGQDVTERLITRVTMRYRTDVGEQDRVIFNGAHMKIKAILPDLRHKLQMTLECWST